MFAVMELTERTILDLLEFADAIGVLTATVGLPRTNGDLQAARIDWKNRRRDLQAAADPAVREALDHRSGLLDDEFEVLLDPRGSTRGRALIVGLESGEVRRIGVQTPFENRAVVRQRAFLRPLVAALDEGRPAGVVIATKSGAKLLEWSAADTRLLSTHDFELTSEQLAADVGGSTSPGSPRGNQVASQREAFDDRVDANRDRFLKEVAGVVADQAADRRWDRVVIAGSARIRDRVTELLSDDGIHIHNVHDHWEDASVGQVADLVWPVLRSSHGRREQRLTAQIREVAMSGGPAALGARRVAAAANLGRISHLAFAHDAEVEGFVGPDDTLHAEMAGPEAQIDDALVPVVHLIERLVERVLSTGGRVTRVDDEDAVRDLVAYQGLGARLRW